MWTVTGTRLLTLEGELHVQTEYSTSMTQTLKNSIQLTGRCTDLSNQPKFSVTGPPETPGYISWYSMGGLGNVVKLLAGDLLTTRVSMQKCGRNFRTWQWPTDRTARSDMVFDPCYGRIANRIFFFPHFMERIGQITANVLVSEDLSLCSRLTGFSMSAKGRGESDHQAAPVLFVALF